MSKTSQFMQNLYELEEIESALKAQLTEAQELLSELVNRREDIIRPINHKKWDLAQYRLDDLEQSLSDIFEELREIAPIESIIENLIAE